MAIFKDERKQELLEKDGVVKFQLLDIETVRALSDYFYEVNPEIPQGFYVCIESPDKEFKIKVHEQVKSLIEIKLNEHLANFRPLVYTMQVKGTGENSKLGVHQDWSVTDESAFRSYSLWVPLIDTNVENGGMFAIKGSHRVCSNVRGPSIPPPYNGHEDFLISKMKHIPVKAGEALLFDQAMLHYTPRNQTSIPRISVISTIIERDADLRLYYLNSESEVPFLELYEAPDQFWFEYKNYAEERFQRPDFGPLKGKISPYLPEKFNEDKFLKALNQVRPKSTWHRIKALFEGS